MPELPDAEVFRRYIARTSLHQRIATVHLTDADRLLRGTSAATLRRTLRGRAFTDTTRHGKYVFVAVGDGPWLVLHFGMSGGVRYARDRPPPPYTKLSVAFRNGYQLHYLSRRKLGRITLADAPERFIAAEGIGPDAYDPRPRLRDVQAILQTHGRAAVKALLMNQAVLAGIGNIYADEMLFQARLDPRTTAGALDDRAAARLHRAMHHVLRAAIDRKAQPDRFPRTWLSPHRHAGGACPRCGARLAHGRVSGRTTWRCTRCQRPAGGRGGGGAA